MCTICLDYKRGAISYREAIMHIFEASSDASEEELQHLEELKEVLHEEVFDNPETD